MGSMSLLHWSLVLLVVVLVFGTKKLANIGADLGGAVKGFRDGVKGIDAVATSGEPVRVVGQAASGNMHD